MAEIDSNYKYLTYEEMAKNIAERVLDEVLYDGKSIREWMQIIASEDCHNKDRLACMLDKIRAEIMDFEEELFHRPNTDYSDYAAVRHCVEIIDKYKAESEVQDADSD